jgi:transcriptional regulator NrdR family protein
MKCPKCNTDTNVSDSRTNIAGSQIRRRRACPKCAFKFSTFERRNDDSLEATIALIEPTLSALVSEVERLRVRMARIKNSKKAVQPLTKRYLHGRMND